MASREALIGYSMSFASFLLDSSVGGDIRKIILFGSVARGDFTSESDIDLFIDTDEKHEKSIEKIEALFYRSKIEETWKLKGITSVLSLKIGRLEAWKLKRDIISSGILLYGKYNEMPEKIRYYLLISVGTLAHKKTSQQMRIWRALYGYTQKVGEKKYVIRGLIEKAGGKKLAKGIFIVPMETRKDITTFLTKNRVASTLHEVWSDSF